MTPLQFWAGEEFLIMAATGAAVWTLELSSQRSACCPVACFLGNFHMVLEQKIAR